MALDKDGNLYIADTGNGRIRKVDTSGIITTVAGKGNGVGTVDGVPATSAQLANPSDVAVDSSGNLYIADVGNRAVRKVNSQGIISTILKGTFGSCQPGSKPAAAADVGAPVALAVDSGGNLFTADYAALCVHKLDTAGNVTTVAGGGPTVNGEAIPPTSIGLGSVTGVAVDSAGNVYLSDSNYGKIRKVSSGSASTGPAPVVTSALNGASFAPTQVLTSGALASLYGTSFASSNASADRIPLPMTLGGVSVTVQGIPAPLVFVSQDQINFQIPWSVSYGPADIVVTANGAASAKYTATLGPVSPGIFSTQFGAGQAIAINADGSLAGPSGSVPGLATRPVRPGETIVILATGLGLVTPAAVSGAASTDALRRTIVTPTVLIGGTAGTVTFSGLSPQFVGVDQLNVIVPNVAPGPVPVQIDVGGIRTTDKVTIAVAAPGESR